MLHIFFRIWEKKFGRNANHKKKEREANLQDGKISAHTSKVNIHKILGPSAATGSTRNSKGENFSQHPVDAGWATRTAGASIPAVAGKDQPLHPSWEAKRRLKEKQGVAIVPSQGKKIKFS